MYFYENEDVATKLVGLEISNREYVIALSEIIKSVVKDFDGKVINKRFVTTLDEKIKQYDGYVQYTHIDYELNSYSFVISVYSPNNSVSNVDGYGCSYVHNRTIVLCRLSPDKAVVYNEKGTARLCANNIIEAIDSGIESLQNYITENKTALDNISDWKAELIELDKRLSSLSEAIPYDVKQYFGLSFSMRKW